MGRRKSTLGAVVDNYKGYNIRMKITTKTDEKTKKQFSQHTGEYGIYAGKNHKQDVGKIADAYPVIDKMISENKKS
jgi:hypothetical protein